MFRTTKFDRRPKKECHKGYNSTIIRQNMSKSECANTLNTLNKFVVVLGIKIQQ
jgi:hypothetical protein